MSAANTPGPMAMTGPPPPVHRRLVLAICCLSVCVTGIDLSIVNVALPSISKDLHASVTSLQWTVSTYSLVMAWPACARASRRSSTSTSTQRRPGRASPTSYKPTS